MKGNALRASELEDVLNLAMWLSELHPRHWPAVLAYVHHVGLMRASGALRPALWLVRRLRGRRGLEAFFSHLAVRSPGAVRAMWWQMLDHIQFGEDTEDEDSRGGWSQRELDLFLAGVASEFRLGK